MYTAEYNYVVGCFRTQSSFDVSEGKSTRRRSMQNLSELAPRDAIRRKRDFNAANTLAYVI